MRCVRVHATSSFERIYLIITSVLSPSRSTLRTTSPPFRMLIFISLSALGWLCEVCVGVSGVPRGALVRRRGVARVVGEHAPQVVAAFVAGHRHHTEQAVGVDPAGGAAAVHIPVEVQVGEQPAFGELDAGERDARQPPGGAGGAVAADDPLRPQAGSGAWCGCV